MSRTMPRRNAVSSCQLSIGIRHKQINREWMKYSDSARAVSLAHFPIFKAAQNFAYDFSQLFPGTLAHPKMSDLE